MVNSKTPHAGIKVWKYKYRTDNDSQLTETFDIKDIISVTTNKNKISHEGKFKVILAPNINYISSIPTGSWIAIFISHDATENNIYDTKNLKMLGRIEDIDISISVNQEDGKKESNYIITGSDWASIFSMNFVIDPRVRGDNDNDIIKALTVQWSDLSTSISNNGSSSFINFISPHNQIRILLNLTATLNRYIAESSKNSPILQQSLSSYDIPDDVIKFLKLNIANDTSKLSKNAFAKYINIKYGTLKERNNFTNADYKEEYNDITEGVTLLPTTILKDGMQIWDIIKHINIDAINECYTEMQLEDKLEDKNRSTVPSFNIYNRIKPFVVSEESLITPGIAKTPNSEKIVKRLSSKYKNLQSFFIPDDEILNIKANVSWKEKRNFVEIRLNYTGVDFTNLTGMITANSQIFDKKAFNREGFRPLNVYVNSFPVLDNNILADKNSIQDVTAWKFLLKEWYFDMHRFLNGNIILYGRNHIPVGSNILINAKSISAIDKMINNKCTNKYFSMHVESVSNTLTTSSNGVKNYVMNIGFSRGAFILDNKVYLLEDDSSEYSGNASENIVGMYKNKGN